MTKRELTMNRAGVARNPYQGTYKKVLCVCSAGCLRSPTAANVLHREYGYNTRSAGLTEDYAIIIVDDVLLEWADEVVVMDKYQQRDIEDMGFSRKIVNLDVPDCFAFMDEELQKRIMDSYASSLEPDNV